MENKNPLITITKEQVSCNLAGESVILNFKDSSYYGLDEIGTHIWDFIHEPKTLNEIEDSILKDYDVTPEVVKKDLTKLLEELKEKGLIEIKSETPA